jgi:hypothetical protein
VTPEEKHSLRSSEREEYVEYIFLGQLCAHGWANDRFVEVARSKTDAFGYDLVLSSGPVTRHVQLKASRSDGSTRSQKINTALAQKPGGCVVWIKVDGDTLAPRTFAWLDLPTQWPAANLNRTPGVKVARHTKGNAQGVKAERANIMEVGWRNFTQLTSIAEVFERLFTAPDNVVPV